MSCYVVHDAAPKHSYFLTPIERREFPIPALWSSAPMDLIPTASIDPIVSFHGHAVDKGWPAAEPIR